MTHSAIKPEATRRLLRPPNPVDIAQLIGAGIDLYLAPFYFWCHAAFSSHVPSKVEPTP